MSKEFELNGCVEVPEDVTEDGRYVMPDGSLGKNVLEEYLKDAESEK